MAGTPAKAAPAKADPREPDTIADKVGAVVEPAALDPKGYGFSTIEPVAPSEGPGVVPPTRVESVTAPEASTFASRAKARGAAKVVTADDEVTGK